jgi:hypothetical protein
MSGLITLGLVPNRCYAHKILDREGGPSSTAMPEQFYSSEMCQDTDDIAPVRQSLRAIMRPSCLALPICLSVES